jgi:hypothetical protein
MTAITAHRAGVFLNTLGVNTHVNYNDGKYANVQTVISDLKYLGITQVRDAAPDPTNSQEPYDVAALEQMMNAGIKLDLIMGGNISSQLAVINQLEKAHPGGIAAIEGPNEINNQPFDYNGKYDQPAADSYQKALYSAVHSDSLLAGVKVYYYTGGPQDGKAEGFTAGATSGADFANAHPYPYYGQEPHARIAQEFRSDYTNTGAYPKVITETGYFDNPSNPYGSGVDDATQAKLTLNLVMDSFQMGIAKTYIYQLLSAYADDGTNTDAEYGLYRLNGTAKPVATDIHNLTTILADSAANRLSFTPGSLNYTITDPGHGAASAAPDYSELLEKANGTFDLVMWSEPTVWNPDTQKPITAAAHTVTVALGSAANVSVFDPTVGTSAISTASKATSVKVSLTDHPIILQISSIQPSAAEMSPASVQAAFASAATTSAGAGATSDPASTAGASLQALVAVQGSTDLIPHAATS